MGNKKVTFIHVPKAAGISIKKALIGAGVDSKYNYLYVHGGLLTKGNEYKKHIQDGFTFCFVRNPWDRLVSNYLYALKMFDNFKDNPARMGTHLNKFRKQIAGYKNFEEFVQNLKPKEVYAHFHFVPQVDFLGEFREYVDFMGRYESLSKDIGTVQKKLGLKLDLPHENAGDRKSKDYKKFYHSNDTIDKVHELYKKDVETFGYKF